MVLSNITDVSRIDEIQRQAVATQSLSASDDHDTVGGRDSDIDDDEREDEVASQGVATDDTADPTDDCGRNKIREVEIDDTVESNAADSSTEGVGSRVSHDFDFDADRNDRPSSG